MLKKLQLMAATKLNTMEMKEIKAGIVTKGYGQQTLYSSKKSNESVMRKRAPFLLIRKQKLLTYQPSRAIVMMGLIERGVRGYDRIE